MRYPVLAVALVACGENRKAPPEASIPPPSDATGPGLAYAPEAPSRVRIAYIDD